MELRNKLDNKLFAYNNRNQVINFIKSEKPMRVTVNKKAFEYAKEMIHKNKFSDKRGSADAKHATPTAQEEEAYIKSYGWDQLSRWYLGVHLDRPENTRNRYEFPMGDFNEIHRSDLLEIQKRAHNNNYPDIAQAAQQLVDLIDKKFKK